MANWPNGLPTVAAAVDPVDIARIELHYIKKGEWELFSRNTFRILCKRLVEQKDDREAHDEEEGKEVFLIEIIPMVLVIFVIIIYF